MFVGMIVMYYMENQLERLEHPSVICQTLKMPGYSFLYICDFQIPQVNIVLLHFFQLVKVLLSAYVFKVHKSFFSKSSISDKFTYLPLTSFMW